MAERRMMSKKIIDSDAFTEMPLSSQALYFHLLLRADDDGFLNNAKKIMRNVGANQNDYDMLLMKRFIIQFDEGVCVIKHWLIHNYIRSDRYKPTQYIEEKDMLSIKENGAYQLIKSDNDLPEGNQTTSIGIPNDNQKRTTCDTNDTILLTRETQVRLGKDRIGKVSIESSINTACPEPEEPAPDREQVISLTLNDRSEFWIYGDQVEQWSQLFPAVDVLQELRKMKSWLDSNPSRRKTKRGILRFVNSWLSREQDKGKLNYRTKAPQISEVDSW